MDSFLYRAATHTKNLPHQKAAWDFVESRLSQQSIEAFKTKFRSAPDTIIQSNSKLLTNFPLISQRDNKGNLDGDRTMDKWQTCNVTSCAMVIQYLTGRRVSPTQLDREVRSKYVSRYVHSNLVKLMADYGVKSDFDVSTTHTEIKENLAKGNPVIWSNKLTHGGHIAVITGFDDDNLFYRIHDPYGEPSPVNRARTKWSYVDSRKPYKLSYKSFDVVNANNLNYYKKEHWCHLCSKA